MLSPSQLPDDRLLESTPSMLSRQVHYLQITHRAELVPICRLVGRYQATAESALIRPYPMQMPELKFVTPIAAVAHTPPALPQRSA